jgi:hypothetical protein
MTHFKGIATPDREPSRNRFADPKRQSKFTEEVAATVVDGDLYFSLQSPAHQRFYVPVEKGEHGQTEAGLLCVTHKFSKRWEDMPGKWEAYDGGGNLVIKIRSADDHDLAYTALDAIEQALYRTPLGRAVGRDALRPMSKSLLTAFGIERDDDFRSRFTVDPDAEKLAKDALRDLLTYAPETGYDEAIGNLGAEYDNIGFAEGSAEYTSLLNGRSNGFGEACDKTPLPLMSQPVFYAVLGGKHEGRGFQNRINALMQAIGLDEEDL